MFVHATHAEKMYSNVNTRPVNTRFFDAYQFIYQNNNWLVVDIKLSFAKEKLQMTQSL